MLRSYISVERTRALLGGRREGVGNVMAAGLGVATPFCSCSAVPAFIGFVAAGVPIGVTLSFLIASPMVNEIAVGLLLTLFGWHVALLYIGAGLTVAVVAGWVLGRLGVQRWVEPFVFETRLRGEVIDPRAGSPSTSASRSASRRSARSCARSGRTCSSASVSARSIHGWVPPDFFTRYAGPGNAFGVLVAVASAYPCTPTPRASCRWSQALHDKGLPMGTLLAFMMASSRCRCPR